MKRAYSILQSCCRRKGKLRKEKEMFASVRKERNGKGDGSSTTITPRALIHAQKLRCTLWTWGKKQIMGHKHIILYIYTYIFTSCNLLLPMIYIKSLCRPVFILSLNKDAQVSFSVLPYLLFTHIHGPTCETETGLETTDSRDSKLSIIDLMYSGLSYF